MVVYEFHLLKKQCYFIPYGEKLECSVSYAEILPLQKIRKSKMIKGMPFWRRHFRVWSRSNYRKKKGNQTHTNPESVGSNQIKGAYAVYELNNGSIGWGNEYFSNSNILGTGCSNGNLQLIRNSLTKWQLKQC
jgi:recombination protein RecT